jgi:hypothetical protein
MVFATIDTIMDVQSDSDLLRLIHVIQGVVSHGSVL